MNNTQILLKIIRFAIVSLLLGMLFQQVTAQTKKEDPKKTKTRVEVKIIKEDDKGNITRIDTSYEVSGDESPKVIVKKIDSNMKAGKKNNKEKEIKVTVISEGEKGDSLSQEIETIVMMDDEMMEAGDFDEDINWVSAGGSGNTHMKMMCCPDGLQSGETFPFGMGMTPWGRITKFEIKEKKHGKVIRIETNDDGMMMMCPPPPPPPPPSMHMEKKVIRINEEDLNKDGKGKVIIMEKKAKPELDRNE